jgi:amino acid transporter
MSGQLRRVLGTWDLTLLAVVAVVNLNVVPVIASNGRVTLWLWLAAILFFFLPQGVAVIELSHHLPGEGGAYLWARHAFGDFHGFMCGWLYWTSNMFFVPTLLFYLSGIPAYFASAAIKGLGEDRLFFFGVTVGLLWLTVWANVRGIRLGKLISNAGGAITVILASLLIGLGVLTAWRQHTDLSLATFSVQQGEWQVLSLFGVVCFAMVGLELGSVMGDEIRDPKRSLPRAVIFGAVIAGLLYVGATVSILIAVPAKEIAVLQGELQAIGRMAGAAGFGWVVIPVAVLLVGSIAGSVSAWVAGSARMMFVSGVDQYLPRVLAEIHPRYGTPHMALITFGVLSTGMISMSFLGASVKEAYLTLLDLSLVLQNLAYLYIFGALAQIAFRRESNTFLNKWVIRWAAVSGLASTTIGTAVSFVPARQISSVWGFEIKLISICALFLGVAALLFRHYSRQRLLVISGLQ